LGFLEICFCLCHDFLDADLFLPVSEGRSLGADPLDRLLLLAVKVDTFTRFSVEFCDQIARLLDCHMMFHILLMFHALSRWCFVDQRRVSSQRIVEYPFVHSEFSWWPRKLQR
jgi:hypothetical protein